MSRTVHSLRFKLALMFAIFGAAISLALALGLFFVAHNLGERLMDETLRAELDDYVSRRARNPNSLPPATVSIQGYVLKQGQPDENIPPELPALREGVHQLMLHGTPYRVAVIEKHGERYVMLFNEHRQNHREEMFVIYLAAGALLMILVSAWLGWWLAGRAVAPLEELANRVFRASPEEDADTVARGFADDEIGQLARVFGSYLGRMRAFIERERNFTSDVSHELRTPLAVVQGVVELMEDDQQSGDKQRERIARISRANREMLDLTNALLLMARENAAGTVAQTIDVCEVVRAAIEMNRHLLSAQTSVELTCRAHPRVSAEGTLLSVVVSNLIRNAFLHTPAGAVSITVDHTGLSISDTGTGIREEEIDRIFQRHFKGNASTGAGIGLSLVKRICDRYGWDIVIHSGEGRGTSAQLSFSSTAATDLPLTLP